MYVLVVVAMAKSGETTALKALQASLAKLKDGNLTDEDTLDIENTVKHLKSAEQAALVVTRAGAVQQDAQAASEASGFGQM